VEEVLLSHRLIHDGEENKGCPIGKNCDSAYVYEVAFLPVKTPTMHVFRIQKRLLLGQEWIGPKSGVVHTM